MYIREATPADIPAIAHIQWDCGRTDVISRYFIRDVDKYPITARKGAIRFIRKEFLLPGSILFVMETEASDYTDRPQDRHQAPEIAGFALWVREGESTGAQRWKARHSDVMSKVNRGLYALEDRYLKLFPTVNPCFRADLFAKILPILGQKFDAEILAESWELELLFISPDWQRRGIGRKLLQFGFDRATEEKVPIILKSSAKGGPMYRHMGFRSLGEAGMGKLFNTTEFGGEDPQLWVWEPEECRGMWYEKGKEAFEKLKAEGGGSAAAGMVEGGHVSV